MDTQTVITQTAVRRVGYRYDLLDKIGQGGMGAVYRAHDCLTDADVALKSITQFDDAPSVLDTRTTRETQLAMAHEFQMVAGLRHPHILTMLDYGFDEHAIPYFTMPLLEDSRRLTDAAAGLSPDGKGQLLAQLLEALIYLHRRGIIHRDLKPENVLVVPSEGVKVLDFGIATSDTTEAGVSGTFPYLAPEIFMGEPASPLSDLYAVGVIAYEMFTGHLPFEGETAQEIVMRIVREPPDLGAITTGAGWVYFIGRLLGKSPTDRFASAVETLNELSYLVEGVTVRESGEVRESFLQAAKFVGRDAEFQQLKAMLKDVLSGQGGALLIGGESGVGKTRLIDELRIYAVTTGALVLRAQAVQGGGLRYQLWRDVLPSLILAADLTPYEAAVLRELVPNIEALIGRSLEDVSEVFGQAQHYRLIQIICDVFSRQTQPILLLLEDLQWTSESLDVLKALLRLVSDQPLLIIGTYRDGERHDLPEELPGMEVMQLRRFSDQTVRSLSAAMLGDGMLNPELVGLLTRETEGNAFFLVEVMRALADDAGRLDQIGRMILPDQVRAVGIERVVRERIARVPRWGQALLQVAAAEGREIDPAELVAISAEYAPVMEGHSLDEWLHVCAYVHVFEAQGDQWRFAHDRMRSQVVDDTEPERVPVVHRQIAGALEAAHGDDPAWADVLLNHWQMAQDADKAVYYLDKVVEWLTWYSAKYDEARERIEQGLAMLPEEDVRRLNLLNHLSEGYWRTGNFPEGARVAEEALRIGLALKAYRDAARSYGNLGIISRLQGQYDQAHDYLMESLRVREAIGDETGIARSYANLGINAYNRSDFAAAQDYYLRSVAIQRKIGDLPGVALNLNNIGQILVGQEQYEQARQFIDEGLAIARQINHRYATASGLSTLGVMAYATGDMASARKLLREALEAFNAISDRYAAAYTMVMLSLVIPTNDTSLRKVISEAIKLSRKIGATPFVLGGVVSAARYYLTHGRTVYALQIIGLARSHPASNSEIATDIDKILVLARETAPDQDIEARMAEGEPLDLESTVKDVLADFMRL